MCSLSLKASHIIGGGFSLVYLGNGQYELQFDCYKDCGPSALSFPPDPISVGMYEIGTNKLVDTIDMSTVYTVPVTFNNVACVIAPVNCVVKRRYSVIRTFDPAVYTNPQGYYISWEQCCRNPFIMNITVPSVTGIVFYMELPPFSMINSSPVFTGEPNTFLCRNEPFFNDFAVTDADGDSLVFSLVDPLRGSTTSVNDNRYSTIFLPAPYEEVEWVPGHGIAAGNIMDGQPDISIGRHTGHIQVTPKKTGLFVFTILCEEYRNGVKIGEVRRDYQYVVVDCPVRNRPMLQTSSNTGFHVNEESCVRLRATDADPADSLEIILLNAGTLLSGQYTFQSSRTLSPAEAEFCFTVNCDELLSDSLELSFMVRDNSCPESLNDTLRIKAALVFPDKLLIDKALPNVFTPNGDGLNDDFRITGEGLINCTNNFEILIFNRWGKKVYSSADVNFRWSGDDAPAGVYFYMIRFNQSRKSGSVTIIR